MYRILLAIHSWNRWIILILGIALIVIALRNWLTKSADKSSTEKTSIFFIIAVDTQLLLGIALYLVSPLIASFMADPGASMKQSGIRFWAVEHTTLMLLGTMAAHVGRVLLKKAVNPVAANRRAAILFIIAMLLILAGVPWPFLEWGRPLFYF